MKKKSYTLSSKIWLYPGMAGWHFITVPKKESAAIKKDFGRHARGWGSLKVHATLGKTSWDTSIFPDSKSGTYLLPLKAHIRKKQEVEAGDRVTFSIDIV
jgi:hypothetical protein